MASTETAHETPRSDAAPPRAVLVGVMRDGKAQRVHANSAGELLEPLSRFTLAWVNFGVEDLKKEGSQVASLLGFSSTLVDSILESPFDNYEDRETELALRVPAVRIRGTTLDSSSLLILIRDRLILTLHAHGKLQRMIRLSRYADTFMRKIPSERPMNDKITMLLNRILNDNNERNFEALRVIQEQGDRIGEYLLTPRGDTSGVGAQVFEVKHLLVQYLNVLWSSLDVVQSLRYGDAELITDDEQLLGRMGIIADDITRQIQLSEHTTEVLVSGLEVLQSVYNNQLQILNNRLAMVVAWLTILGTLILVPNTLATLFGPVTDYWGRPEFWVYVSGTAGLTAIATWYAYHFVRRRQLLKGDVR